MPQPPRRTVQCYHCRHRLEVSARCQSTSCPHCNKPVHVSDVTVDGLKGPLREVRTCGRIHVQKKGTLMAEFVEAHGGIDCEGIIEAKHVLSAGPVTLGAKCQFKGALSAPSLTIGNGARLTCGQLKIPDDPVGAADLAP